MANERDVDQAIANIRKELTRAPQYVDRDWYTRVKSSGSDGAPVRDWSGAGWAGQWAGGGNWAGGRDR
jgi:hypothetical protein